MDTPECGNVRKGMCPTGFYPKGVVVFSTCAEYAGASSFNMVQGSVTFITDIPADTNDLSIALTSEVDIDLQLSDEDICIAGYGCLYPNEATFKYDGMEIYFSGDSRKSPVEE